MRCQTIDRPACLAIRAWLVENKGTIAEIMLATGYCLSTVEKCIGALRRAGEPQARNVVRSRIGAPKRPRRHRMSSMELDEREAAKEARELEAAKAAAVAIVSSALAHRTPLEQAWGAMA